MRILLGGALLLAACTTSVAPAAPTASPPSAGSPTARSPLPDPTGAATAAPTATATATAPRTPIALPSSAEIWAPSRDVVWTLVAGTRLFRSTDEGATWQERALPSSGPALALAFANEREGWAVALGSPATQCQQQDVSLWRTLDGAATWSLATIAGIPAARCKGTPALADALHGFVDAWDPSAPPAIYRTSDGGRTWSASQPLPDPPGFVTAGGSALRVGRVRPFGATLLVEATGQQDGRQRSYAYRSSDGGATWRHVATAPDEPAPITFVTESRWLRFAYPVRETTDAGLTWHDAATDYQQAAPIPPAVVFGDPSVGYATVRGTIKRTLDGGAHWLGIATPGT